MIADWWVPWACWPGEPAYSGKPLALIQKPVSRITMGSAQEMTAKADSFHTQGHICTNTCCTDTNTCTHTNTGYLWIVLPTCSLLCSISMGSDTFAGSCLACTSMGVNSVSTLPRTSSNYEIYLAPASSDLFGLQTRGVVFSTMSFLLCLFDFPTSFLRTCKWYDLHGKSCAWI